MAQTRPQTAATLAGMLTEPGGIERIRLAWRLARDQRVAPFVKMLIPAIIALYVLSPIDLIPDFFLGLGQVDDLGIIAVGLALAVRILPKLAPADLVSEHLAAIRGEADPAVDQHRREEPRQTVIDADFRVRGQG